MSFHIRPGSLTTYLWQWPANLRDRGHERPRISVRRSLFLQKDNALECSPGALATEGCGLTQVTACYPSLGGTLLIDHLPRCGPGARRERPFLGPTRCGWFG